MWHSRVLTCLLLAVPPGCYPTVVDPLLLVGYRRQPRNAVTCIAPTAESHLEAPQVIRSENCNPDGVSRFFFGQPCYKTVTVNPRSIKRHNLITGVQALFIRRRSTAYCSNQEAVACLVEVSSKKGFRCCCVRSC